MQIVEKTFSEEDLLTQLKEGSEKAFKQLYYSTYDQVAAHIRKNAGSTDDAQDLFQEALMVFVKNLRKSDFQIDAKPGAYLFGIVKKMWLYKLRGKKGKSTLSIEYNEKDMDFLFEEESSQEEKFVLLEQVFDKIAADCKKLLAAFYYKNKSLTEIASMMGYTAQFVRVKKYRCMNNFKKLIEEHPNYKNI